MKTYKPYLLGICSPLAVKDFNYVQQKSLAEFDHADWMLIDSQRERVETEVKAWAILSLVRALDIAQGWGYRINPFRHSLQAATMAMEDGKSEEYVIAALIHDLGILCCAERHGVIAATVGSEFLPGSLLTMLKSHDKVIKIFEQKRGTSVDLDRLGISNSDLELTIEFVSKYDQTSIIEDKNTAPLEYFFPILVGLLKKCYEHED